MFSITNEYLAFAERRLLPEGQVFDAQRRELIRCMESIDVLACPGSGKTTALVAKLLIIAEQLPLKGNKGVCVLTHTNVAIDTITQNIEGSAGKLFRYPNFFGTIQSFVDRYLAIPAFVERYSKRPNIIDNDWYHAKIDKQKFIYLPREAMHFCHKSGYKEYPRSIRFCDLQISPLHECEPLRLDLTDPKDKRIYDALLILKQKVLQLGVLSYDDAYYLATGYLAVHPSLTALFSRRFPYVFIDEMQDTDSRQTALLNRLFDESVVIQRIGDINQAIFGLDTTGDEECAWAQGGNTPIEITGSKRFSNAIATVIAPICVIPQALTGNPEVPDISPRIIAFEDEGIQRVIPRFGDLIFEEQLHLHPRPRFKVVGWTGKPHPSKHTIPSYWPFYQKEVHTERMEYSSLASYVQPRSDEVISQSPVNYYRKAIIRALLKCLRIADRPGTTPLLSEKAFLAYISNKDKGFHDDLHLKLARWCLAICKNESVLHDLAGYIESDFSHFFDVRSTKELEDFLAGVALPALHEGPVRKSNIYVHNRGDEQIEIEVCTIHLAKGETHTATLYLETFCYDYDIVRIIGYLEGKYTAPTQKRVENNLRMAYVGMSRPSHFLCVAVHNAHLSDHSDQLREAGWEIDNVLID